MLRNVLGCSVINYGKKSAALLELGNKLDAGINRFEDKLEKEILKDIIIKRLQDENSILKERVRDLENKVESNLQYQRRNNIIIDGLPCDLSEGRLEDQAMDVLRSIDIKIDSCDIEACHYLPSRNERRKVIMKMVNRKHAEQALKNRGRLKKSDKSLLGRNLRDQSILITNAESLKRKVS